MGGKRLASVSGVPYLSKEGWRGCWGGDMGAGGKRVGYIWDLYVQAFHVCLFCLWAANREREGYVLFEVEVVEGSDGWMMEEDSFQRREGGI